MGNRKIGSFINHPMLSMFSLNKGMMIFKCLREFCHKSTKHPERQDKNEYIFLRIKEQCEQNFDSTKTKNNENKIVWT